MTTKTLAQFKHVSYGIVVEFDPASPPQEDWVQVSEPVTVTFPPLPASTTAEKIASQIAELDAQLAGQRSAMADLEKKRAELAERAEQFVADLEAEQREYEERADARRDYDEDGDDRAYLYGDDHHDLERDMELADHERKAASEERLLGGAA